MRVAVTQCRSLRHSSPVERNDASTLSRLRFQAHLSSSESRVTRRLMVRYFYLLATCCIQNENNNHSNADSILSSNFATFISVYHRSVLGMTDSNDRL